MRKRKLYTEEVVHEALQAYMDSRRWGAQAAFAREIGKTRAFVNDMLSEKCPIPAYIATKILGHEVCELVTRTRVFVPVKIK